jgi:hypothetical protein
MFAGEFETELVQSCSGSGNCSRYSCWPLLGESFQCLDVTNNKYCTSQSGNGTCTQVRADYSKSYVRLPPFAATELTSLPVEISNSICSQRQLDPTFQNISARTSFNLVYFGAVDGSFRGFPGRVSIIKPITLSCTCTVFYQIPNLAK